MFVFLFSYPGAGSVSCFSHQNTVRFDLASGWGWMCLWIFCQDPPGSVQNQNSTWALCSLLPLGVFIVVVDHYFPWPGEGTVGLDPEPGAGGECLWP